MRLLGDNAMRRHIVLLVTLFAVLAAGAVGWQVHRMSAKSASNAGHTAQPQSIPVTAGVAKTDNVPVYRTGLGTVQAFNTVTVKVRVDGQLNTVAFTEGQDVKAGDILAQIDPRPFQATLDQAKATQAKDEAQLANARLDLTRFVQLGEYATRQSVDTQKALVRQLEAAVQADAAAVENAQVQLDYTTVRAPLSGRTGLRLVDPGNIVHAADPNGLVVITQLQPISVVFTLPQDQLQEVLKELPSGNLKAFAMARTDGAQLAEGTLALVDNQIDPSTGTVRMKATFANENLALWPGQFVNIRLQVRTLEQVVTVPSPAIQRGPDGMYVYVIKPDSTVAVQPVTVAEMTMGSSVIQSGLAAGANIVVSGQYRLQPGSHVQTGVATAGNAKGG
jgi:membrane fusion protein, multidrug efflux system